MLCSGHLNSFHARGSKACMSMILWSSVLHSSHLILQRVSTFSWNIHIAPQHALERLFEVHAKRLWNLFVPFCTGRNQCHPMPVVSTSPSKAQIHVEPRVVYNTLCLISEAWSLRTQVRTAGKVAVEAATRILQRKWTPKNNTLCHRRKSAFQQ